MVWWLAACSDFLITLLSYACLADTPTCTVCVQVPYEQLRLLLEERTSECEVLRNRLEQREASLEVTRKNYEAQVNSYPSLVCRHTWHRRCKACYWAAACNQANCILGCLPNVVVEHVQLHSSTSGGTQQ